MVSLSFLQLLLFPSTILAFQQHKNPSLLTQPTFIRHEHSSTALRPVISQQDPDPLSFPEQTRVKRRDFYTHASWLKHRRKERFFSTMIKVFESGVVRALKEELLVVGGIATLVVLYNAIFVAGWEDFGLIHHDPIVNNPLPLLWLPITGFTLSSPALGLVLVFKTNTSYQRWDEARKAWGVIVNNSRSIARESSAWIHQTNLPDEEKWRLVRRIADAVWLFPRSCQRHLLQAAEDEEPYAKDVRERLPNKKFAEAIISARHKPTLAMYEMSSAVNQLPLDTVQRSTIDKCISSLCDAIGGCERIFGSPVPVIYTRFTARFVEFWMVALPLGLYKPFEGTWNHWAMIPVSVILGFFFLGIEELSIQLEEPFSVLPLAKIAEGIGLAADDHVEWMENTIRRTGNPSFEPPGLPVIPADADDSDSPYSISQQELTRISQQLPVEDMRIEKEKSDTENLLKVLGLR